jgi:hypothetical protein
VVDERGKAVLTAQFAAVHEVLRTIPDLALVVLDPLQCFVHADVNADPQAAAIVMAALNMLAAETGATVLATHYVRKENEAPMNAQEARHLIRGSSALVDQSRFAIVLWQPNAVGARRRHLRETVVTRVAVACRTLGSKRPKARAVQRHYEGLCGHRGADGASTAFLDATSADTRRHRLGCQAASP